MVLYIVAIIIREMKHSLRIRVVKALDRSQLLAMVKTADKRLHNGNST